MTFIVCRSAPCKARAALRRRRPDVIQPSTLYLPSALAEAPETEVTKVRAIGNILRQESVSLQALVQAVIALGLAFNWWNWSDGQTGAVVGIAAALLSMFARSQVTPTIRPRSADGKPLVPQDG